MKIKDFQYIQQKFWALTNTADFYSKKREADNYLYV